MASGAVDGRPAVSVIIPFGGDAADAAAVREAIARLQRSPGDEVLIVDNTTEGTFPADALPEDCEVLRAAHERSSYTARNVGAEAARSAWLLFIDADTTPNPDLLDAYFARSPLAATGALAGAVLPADASIKTRVARYQARRQPEMQSQGRPHRQTAVTANLLVRHRAWEEVGGFHEGIRSSGDHDFTWRLQDAGWRLESRPDACVRHAQRQNLKALLRLHARYGSGRRWLHSRHPEARSRSVLGQFARPILRSLLRAVQAGIRGRREPAGDFTLDAAVHLAETAGYFGAANRASPVDLAGLELILVVDQFPELSETFVVGEAAGLAARDVEVGVLALRRAGRPRVGAARRCRVLYLEDLGHARRFVDLAWLACHRPRACLADLLGRRRWSREEHPLPLRAFASAARRLAGGQAHLHAHFATAGALTALRLARLLDRPYSVTVHGYDVYKQPQNLSEKLQSATFVIAPCEAMASDVRRIIPGADVDVVVMGVDPAEFSRTVPVSSERLVLAVGRLVEKKGFVHLAAAARLLADDVPAIRVVIAGDGPLRAELAAAGHVELVGALPPAGVRRLLERAAVVAVPCVVAGDGDQDSMPLIAKEALAMEVPVVASDLAGLPEVVREPWGRLVPPAEPVVLAEALREMVDLSAAERARIGAIGRVHVVEHCSLDAQVEGLLALVRRPARRS